MAATLVGAGAPLAWQAAGLPLLFLGLGVAHAGVRLARKTYLVDIATGDRRTEYTAVSNSVIDRQPARHGGGLEDVAFQRRHRLAGRHARGQHSSRHDVVGQHGGQQRRVGQQRILGDAEFGQQGGESVVGRREDRQRAGRRQGVDEAGGHDRLDQDAELRCRNGRLHDVLVGRQQHAVDRSTPASAR